MLHAMNIAMTSRDTLDPSCAICVEDGTQDVGAKSCKTFVDSSRSLEDRAIRGRARQRSRQVKAEPRPWGKKEMI